MLEPGSLVVFYSDGLVASQNELGEPYGETRLADVLARCVTRSPAEIAR